MAKRTTIDAAGRLVIPKDLRERFGLHSGTALEIAAEDEQIVIRVAAEEAPMVERGGILIVTSKLAGPAADERLVREERLDRLSGS